MAPTIRARRKSGRRGSRIPPLKLYDKGVRRDDICGCWPPTYGTAATSVAISPRWSARRGLAERRLTTLVREFGAARSLAAVEAMLDASRAADARRRHHLARRRLRGPCDARRRWARPRRHRDPRARDKIGLGPDGRSDGIRSAEHKLRELLARQHAIGCRDAFAYLIDADIPKNDGAFRALKVIAKPGTVVWANEGAPVTLCTSHCSNEIVEAIITALADACPDRAMAGWGRRFRIAIAGTDPRTRRKFIWHLFQARPGRRCIAGGRWMAGRRRVAFGRRHQVRQRRGRRGALSIALHPPRIPARLRRRRTVSRRAGRGARARHRDSGVGRRKYRRRRRALRLARSGRRQRWQAAHLCPSSEIGQTIARFARRKSASSFRRATCSSSIPAAGRLGRSGARTAGAACGGSTRGLVTDESGRT